MYYNYCVNCSLFLICQRQNYQSIKLIWLADLVNQAKASKCLVVGWLIQFSLLRIFIFDFVEWSFILEHFL